MTQYNNAIARCKNVLVLIQAELNHQVHEMNIKFHTSMDKFYSNEVDIRKRYLEYYSKISETVKMVKIPENENC